MKLTFLVPIFVLVLLSLPPPASAQTLNLTPLPATSSTLATDSALIATPSAEQISALEKLRRENITQPEEPEERGEVLELFRKRHVENPEVTNFVAFFVQRSVISGVPANTVILILLLPLLATIVAFLRHIVGIPSLEILLPIALSITLLATGVTAGMLLLLTILIASTLARLILKKVRIMQLPKLSLSIFVVALFVFLSLTLSANIGILTVRQISIFPILLLILLSERIVALQIERNTREAFVITSATLVIAISGFFLLSSNMIREFVLLYPESVFLLIPVNLAIGRYFGLRLSEYFRFQKLFRHGSK